ncbi:hypothetical protein [Vasconcelosia minhoensis]|nr:hypothetical protein [Romeria gracilis]
MSDRGQVTVRSLDSSFDQRDREAWIEKFDLLGLAKLVQTE